MFIPIGTKIQMKSVLDYWPFPYSPRQSQVAALEWLDKQDSKYLLLEAPVGVGKSNIGITYSHAIGSRLTNYRGDSFILTPQRILQSQYERSFHGEPDVSIASFYGRSNYQCQSRNTSCDIGGLIKPRCEHCPFQMAKKDARVAANTVLNYKLALISFAFTEIFKPRELMILDECHTVENHLVDFDAFTVSEARCKRYDLQFKSFSKVEDALYWLGDYYLPEIQQVMLKLTSQCEEICEKPSSNLTTGDLRKLRELSRLVEHVDEARLIACRTPDYLNTQYVLVNDKVMFQFKRLKGEYSFHKFVNPMANRFLFMSSTILDRKGFCEDLGIPEKDAAFLSLQSEFDKEHRPIFYMPQMKVNTSWKSDENKTGRKRLADAVEKLLSMHVEHKGIIHTANFAMATWLDRELHNRGIDHKIFHHNPSDNEKIDRNGVIDEFQNEPKPAILISPSSTEGLDLKDDLGRFAIFVKVPFPYLGDQWIKRRMQLSKNWYMRQALINIIQGGGRVVRTEDDWGHVYLLDESWAYLFNQSQHMVPDWWKESYQTL